VIIGAIAELERNLIVARVRAGMRRAKLEGRHIGRKPLVLDRDAILRDRQRVTVSASWRRATSSPEPPFTACSRSTPQPPGRSPHEGKHHHLYPDIHAACRCFRLHDRLGLRQQVCRRKNAEQQLAELSTNLPRACSGTKAQQRQFKELRSVLNDAHKHILAVSKALKIPAR
jgi:hypothetical protein